MYLSLSHLPCGETKGYNQIRIKLSPLGIGIKYNHCVYLIASSDGGTEGEEL